MVEPRKVVKPLHRYVVISPVRNEERYIELTLQSMITQTVTPLKWMIVSDGSTDGTDALVEKYAEDFSWIELVRLPERKERNFSGKVNAFNAGYEKVVDLTFDVIGNLDGDISFKPEYFEFILNKFSDDCSLGVAGTPFIENGRIAYDYNFTSPEHVSGQCQLFRRACFEDIGGYQPIPRGGIDWTAVNTARMKGWKTRTFSDQVFVHHKVMGTGMTSWVWTKFRFGIQDYCLGSHPLWQLFRGIYQLSRPPYILGGLLLLSGYFWAFISGVKKTITPELQSFRRREQMSRLSQLLVKLLPLYKIKPQ